MAQPLTAEAIAAICEHMNEDHADAIASYARTYAGIADAQTARMSRLDAAGMDLAVETPDGVRSAHVAFDHVLEDAGDARDTLIRMAREAHPAT